MDLLKGLANELQSLRDEVRGRAAETTVAMDSEVTLVPVSIALKTITLQTVILQHC